MRLSKSAIKLVVVMIFLSSCSFKKLDPCISDDHSKTQKSNINQVVCFETIDSYDLDYSNKKHLNIYGNLYFPKFKKESYNAIILSHGSGGIRRYHNQYIEYLTDAGYLVFQIDHYLARGIKYDKTFSKVSGITFMNDSYKALELLKSFSNIDKIAYLGWSQGGVGPILTHFDDVSKRLSSLSFDAAVAIYPYCGFTFDENTTTNTPLLIITGKDDDLTPEKACLNLYNKFSKGASNFQIVSMEGARHGFDNPFLFFGFKFKNLPSLNDHSDQCTLTINKRGNIVTVAGEIIYGPKESSDIINRCSNRGVMVKYNSEATRLTQTHILNFLLKTMHNM